MVWLFYFSKYNCFAVVVYTPTPALGVEEQEVQQKAWTWEKELKAEQIEEAKQIIEEVESCELVHTSLSSDNSCEIHEQMEAKHKEQVQICVQHLQEWQEHVQVPHKCRPEKKWSFAGRS